MGKVRGNVGGWSRRDFLKRAGAGAAVAPLAACSSSAVLDGLRAGVNPFNHGVASGDPLTDRVMLWTRVTPPPGMTLDIPATVTVADDPALQINARALAVTRGPIATGP